MYNGDLNKAFTSFPFTYQETISMMKTWARHYFYDRRLTPGKVVQVEPCKKFVIRMIVAQYTDKKYRGCYLDFTKRDQQKIDRVLSCLEPELIQICKDEIARQPGIELFQNDKYLMANEVITSTLDRYDIKYRTEAQKHRMKIMIRIQNDKDIVFFLNYKDCKNSDTVEKILTPIIHFRETVIRFGHDLIIQ